MAYCIIEYLGKPLTVHKAIVSPEFNAKTVLVTDTWDFIDLWLKRNGPSRARFFWDQARQFFAATKGLPKESSPLTAYYGMLNATKALLLVKRLPFAEHHGVAGESVGKRFSISNEQVTFKSTGILSALCAFLGETVNGEQYSLRDLLYNLVYIHRAFSLSVPSCPELFVPIRNPQFVRSNRTNESWFCAELEGRHASMHTVNKLPAGFERDNSVTNRFIVRKKKRFAWKARDKSCLIGYGAYHRKLRKDLHYIYSSQRLWYLKRRAGPAGFIPRSSLPIAFAAMHKLSELARYSPDLLAKHFDGRYNWLLSEFIAVAPMQFIDSLSSEMTGYDFMPPGRVV
jgi:hypothetical protein